MFLCINGRYGVVRKPTCHSRIDHSPFLHSRDLGAILDGSGREGYQSLTFRPAGLRCPRHGVGECWKMACRFGTLIASSAVIRDRQMRNI